MFFPRECPDRRSVIVRFRPILSGPWFGFCGPDISVSRNHQNRDQTNPDRLIWTTDWIKVIQTDVHIQTGMGIYALDGPLVTSFGSLPPRSGFEAVT